MTEQIEQLNETNVEIRPTFQAEIDDNHIAVVRILSPEKEANWLPENCVEELRNMIGKAIYQQVRGILLISARPKNFIQGFKLSILQNKTEAQLRQFSQEMQLVMREINKLKIPVVAAIDGNCFGAGLELALACDYRIVSDEVYTQFAMPQIRSGILPFAGGTQRLPRLIGLKQAANILSSGQKVDVEHALKMGLVDMAVPANRLFQVAYQLLLDNKVAKADYKQTKNVRQKWRKKIEGTPSLRNRMLERLENHLWQDTFGNYPAVVELIELLKEPHFKQGLALEQEGLVKLINTETAKVLVNLKKTERAMKDKYAIRGNVRDVLQVSVLGSGYMGAGIAYLTANNARIPVRIKDIQPSEIQKALRSCYELMRQEVRKKQLREGEMIQRMNLITGGERLVAAKSTDFILEAVYEDLKLKQRMLQESENYYDEHAIFATNTSTFSIKEIASVAKRPENVLGFHYFSPVIKQQLVEIIPHEGTCEHTIATAIHFAIQQGKVPLLVSDTQGFFINRLLTPLLLEAIQCVIDGEAIEFIDRSLQEFGFKIGPLAMIDEMGLDVLNKATPSLVYAFGERFCLPEATNLLIRNERKGCKNKRGFYMYDKYGTRLQEDKSIYHVMEKITQNNLESEEIARRCILRMINEAAWCLYENVIQSPEEGNVASVLGTGFPQFRGGIYAYMEKVGAKEIVKQLKAHQKIYGDRFEPCPWLIELAEQM